MVSPAGPNSPYNRLICGFRRLESIEDQRLDVVQGSSPSPTFSLRSRPFWSLSIVVVSGEHSSVTESNRQYGVISYQPLSTYQHASGLHTLRFRHCFSSCNEWTVPGPVVDTKQVTAHHSFFITDPSPAAPPHSGAVIRGFV